MPVFRFMALWKQVHNYMIPKRIIRVFRLANESRQAT